jgi:AraC family transcriptional regulator
MATAVSRVTPSLMEAWQLTVLHHTQTAGVLLWDIALPRHFVAPPHEHELPFFCVLTDGCLENDYPRGPIAYHRLLNVYHPAGTVHSGVAGPQGARIFTLETTAAWAHRLDGLPALPTSPTPLLADDGGWLVRRLLAELQNPQRCSDLVVEGLTLELLAEAVRAPREDDGPPPWLARVLDRLHGELERPVTLQAIAADLGVHPTRLSTLFRRHTGKTVGDYRRELQVQFVRQRLRDRRCADEPLADIALAAGFADQAHCTRVFKAATGWTPARFRNALLRGVEPLVPPVPG